ncbi:MAG: sugar ABC transporter permease [bacterium]|nr:sugar ABC transporter permease [bacterium]
MNLRWLNTRRRNHLFGLMLLIPAMVILGFLFINPIITLVKTSLTNKNMLKPKSGKFIGLENYIWMFTETDFWDALGKSLIYTLGVTVASIVISMLIALLMNFEFLGRRACFALILLPWVTSYMASAFVYTLLFDYSYGVFNFLFTDLLKLTARQNWLGDLKTVMGSVITVAVWHFLPFSILVLTNAIKQVPTDVYESARIDGAGAVRTFRSITLPMIKPSLVTLLIVRIAAVFKSFDSIFLLTKGGPGDATTTLPLYYYEVSFGSYRVGKGSAIGVALILIVLLIYFILIKMFGEDAV